MKEVTVSPATPVPPAAETTVWGLLDRLAWPVIIIGILPFLATMVSETNVASGGEPLKILVTAAAILNLTVEKVENLTATPLAISVLGMVYTLIRYAANPDSLVFAGSETDSQPAPDDKIPE